MCDYGLVMATLIESNFGRQEQIYVSTCGNLTYRLKVISLALLTEYASGNGCDLYIAAITEIVLAYKSYSKLQSD